MLCSKKVACILVKEATPVINKLAEACFRFTSQIALRKDEAIFLEVGKSSSLFSERTLEFRIIHLAQRLGLSVKVSFAKTPSLAWLKAHFFEKIFEDSQQPDFSKLPLQALIYFLSPFEKDCETENKILSWIPIF